MNWRRLYAVLQIQLMVLLTAMIGAGCWSFLVAGLCRVMLKLDEDMALLAIGLPLFIVLLIVLIRLLPKQLRKAGMLSDDPVRFGPWRR